MMIENYDELHAQLKWDCNFISTYASALLGCGATCTRIEKNTRRIAEKFNVDIDITLLPSHALVTLWDKEHNCSYSNSLRMRHGGIDFSKNTALSKLSWTIANGEIDRENAQRRMEEILNEKPLNKWLVLFLTSLANASFCRLFGGDAVAMGIVFVATLAGFLLKQVLLEDKIEIEVVTVLSAFLASVIGTAGYVFSISSTPDVALATSVLFLVPGIPYINAVSDMIGHHYVCSFSRFIQGAVLTVCLSLGLCCGVLLMHIKLM